MLLKRRVIIKRNRSYEKGKYGLTINGPGQSAPTVKPLATDEELSNLLLDLGFTRPEVDNTPQQLDKLKETQPTKAYLDYDRSIDAAKLKKHGF